MSEKNSGSFIGGMLLGTAIGTIAGMLIAPRTGKETRQILKKSAQALPELAEDISSSVQLQADRLSETALRNWDGTLTRLKEALAAGLEAGVKERQILEKKETVTPSDRQPSRDIEQLYSNSYASGVKVTNQDGTIVETLEEQEN